MRNTLLIISIGELGTHVLEGVARSGLFDRIVVASRSLDKATQRINCTRIGAGIEGCFPQLESIELDFNNPASVETLRAIDPDVVFTAPTLMPWWKIDRPDGGDIPFGGYISLHLAPMITLRERLAKANLRGHWIAASYPDVINPILCSTGYGPTCGIGNVQEPIAKIQYGVAQDKGVDPNDVRVRLVAQHAFEYHVMRERIESELPPYLLEVVVNGQDESDVGERVLRAPFPFPFDLHFNRVTASACVMTLKALTDSQPVHTHLPGFGGLVGGYPVTVECGKIELDLATHWTRERAIEINQQSLVWDGIQAVQSDGTVVFCDHTVSALKKLTGVTFESVDIVSAPAQAEQLLSALR